MAGNAPSFEANGTGIIQKSLLGALFLENLALEANWPGPLKKPAAKLEKFVNEHLWPYSGTHGFEKNDTPSIISSSPETCKSVEPILNSFPTLFPL